MENTVDLTADADDLDAEIEALKTQEADMELQVKGAKQMAAERDTRFFREQVKEAQAKLDEVKQDLRTAQNRRRTPADQLSFK